MRTVQSGSAYSMIYSCVARNCPYLRRVGKADVDVALGQKKYVGILAEVDANEFGGLGETG